MVITITCPSCSSSFPVDPAKIPEGGVNARCSSCGDVFRVEKPVEPEPLPTLEDLEPEPAAAEPEPMPSEPEPTLAEPEPTLAEPVAEEPELADVEPTFSEPLAAEPEVAAVEPPPLPDVPDLPDVVPDVPDLPDVLPEVPGLPEVVPEAPVAETADPFAEPAPFEGQRASDAPVEKPPVQGFTFGKRDPTDKARRLARVLVSDMIMYNAERHQSALAAGTIAQDFEEEIDKSWKEFVDQVGEDLANGEGRQFWTQALNDILAKGQQIF